MKNWLTFSVPALTAIIVDQLSKAAALAALTYGAPVPVMPGFNLTLGFNTGTSFGMMGGFMADKPLLMAALTGAENGGEKLGHGSGGMELLRAA